MFVYLERGQHKQKYSQI